MQRIIENKVVPAMREAGFNVTAIGPHTNDVTVDGGEDVLNFTVQDDGTVTWDDFTHCTRIADFNDHPGMVAVFRELLPLRDADLQSWIEGRQYK
jgi:hypothetical protein